MTKPFYVTTPIYYVNDRPHIGHAYTTVLADVLHRAHRLFGDESYFLTGTDEHGQKVEQAARKAGMDPQAHCDLYSGRFKDAWVALGVSYDQFIRTTDAAHKAFVREQIQRLFDAGDIYEKEYEGWYSTGEERFFTEKELVDGKDPISHRPVELIREKNYFFRMSKYQAWLIGHIEANPAFILPEFRRNEVLGFLRQPLADLCISRPKARLAWGIPLPFDENYVAYVWVDALLNYWSAVKDRKWKDGSAAWPATVHLIGKDILTTHCVYWTTILRALGAPQPEHILAHGWWMKDGQRMSKTTGNVVDPIEMAGKFGADVFRYYLMRDMVVGQDGDFTDAGFAATHNADLANDLGNLFSRTHKLVEQHFAGAAPAPARGSEADRAIVDALGALFPAVEEDFRAFRVDAGIKKVIAHIRELNRYIDAAAPWRLAKTDLAATGTVLYHILDGLRAAATLLSPVMPVKMAKLLELLGIPGAPKGDWQRAGAYPVGVRLAPVESLFPKIELAAAEIPAPAAAQPAPPAAVKAAASEDGLVTVDEFFRTKLVSAKILAAEPVEGTDKLVKLSVDAGEATPRTVVAGIRLHYAPEALVGRQIVLVANLAPRKLKGIESRGMLLCAKMKTEAGEKLVLIAPESDAAPGSPVG
ncbi:MAG: methionine--tRNA ligase [Spirochaetes bacterium]|nr:methionine--tRNA ligase [Spirochaetota bacterium]